jgi:endonuclease-3
VDSGIRRPKSRRIAPPGSRSPATGSGRRRRTVPLTRWRAESLATRGERAGRLIASLKRAAPAPRVELDHRTPFQLLIATILSAQCTDARVNLVTPDLFAAYPDAAALARARPADLERHIRSTGFYRAKARSILGCCRALLERHGGEVPRTMQELVRLPGVGRKTANVILGAAFDQAAGIVVDTHMARVARRLGLTRAADPVRIERDLMRIVPRSEWIHFSVAMILHGRYVCVARRPRCAECVLSADCPSRDPDATPPRPPRRGRRRD